MATPTFEAGRPVEPSSIFTPGPASTTGLPAAVAERFFAIVERAETLHAAIPPSDQRLELGNEKVKAEQRLQQLEMHPGESNGLRQQKALVAELAAAKERTEARYQRTTEAWQKAAQVRRAVEEWLRDKPPNCAVEDWPTELPRLIKGETGILDAVERYRRRARELVADLRRVEAAPYPRDYCFAKATAEVLALAERGRISASALVEHDGRLVFPIVQLASQIYNVEARGAVAYGHDVPDVLGILAAIHTDAMIAAVCKAVDEECDGEAGLSHDERERQSVQIESDLLAAEREECALTWVALSQALPIEHRADASVQAILQCRLVVVPPPPAGSSPERASYDLIGGRQR